MNVVDFIVSNQLFNGWFQMNMNNFLERYLAVDAFI